MQSIKTRLKEMSQFNLKSKEAGSVTKTLGISIF